MGRGGVWTMREAVKGEKKEEEGEGLAGVRGGGGEGELWTMREAVKGEKKEEEGRGWRG